MAAPATANEFLAVVRKSGLLDEKAFSARYQEDELPDDPQACAAELTRADLLTPFQAKTLLTGKYKGFVLGPYRVLQPIGKGGMGVVYLAEHTSLKRRVAVKILPKEYADDRLALERFFREARAAAALDHPNIVGIHDITQGAGTHFLVMEYVEGITLEELMEKTGRMHYAQAVDYVAQAANGLRHAHEKGFVHRDVKPSNLMVTKDGRVKVLDMGLARSFENPTDNLTAQLGDGAVAGTADFVSPEQALNDPVDARSDVYSLGATLYALIAGRPPFTGNTSQKLLQHQLSEPPKLMKTNATVPAELSDVVGLMMAKNPDDRIQSAADVIDALTPWLPAGPGSTTAVGHMVGTKELTGASTRRRTAVAPAAAPAGRKKLYLGLGAGGLVAAVVVAVVAFGSKGGKLPDRVVQQPDVPKKADVPKSVKVPGLMARVTWDEARPFKAELKGVQKSSATAGNPLPKPWAVATTRSGMTGEFEVIDAAEGRLLAVRNVNRNTPGIQLMSDDPLATLKVNVAYQVKVEYRTETGVKAWVEARYSADPAHRLARKTLPETYGEWATAELEVTPTVEVPLYLVVCNDGKNTERLFVKRIDVVDPRVTAPTRGGGRYVPVPLDALVTACSTGPLFGQGTQLDLEDWGPKTVHGVPFVLIDPGPEKKSNVLLFHAKQGTLPPTMPKEVVVPIRSRASAIHVLGGVSSWGWPYAEDNPARGTPQGTPALVVTLKYADGQTEKHEWRNGIEIADNSYALFPLAKTVAGSQLAFDLKNKRQVRYHVLVPQRTAEIAEVVMAKSPEDEVTAPMVFALTVEQPPAAGATPTGSYLVLPFDRVATACTGEKLFSESNNQMIEFEAWGAKEFNGVPFTLVNPANGTKNIILLNGSQGQAPPAMPKVVTVPVDAPVATFHVLGGVSGWGWPYAPDASGMTRGAAEGTVSVIVRVRYADGATEDHPWKNGEHVCDYSLGNNAERMAGLTGSTLAFELKGKRHVRYLTVKPARAAVVKELEFVKGPDDDWTAPMIVAVTAERGAGPTAPVKK